jgi:hypothetical protein
VTQPSPACPKCGQADKTYKVSLLYLESAARLSHLQEGKQPELDELLFDMASENISQVAQNQLVSRFAQSFSPPPGEKQNTRRIHPDTMIIFFALFSLLLVFQIAISQPTQLPAILILLASSLLAYLLTRKRLLKRFEDRIRLEQEANSRIENAVTRWMHLYFCSRDKAVFNPEQNLYVPLEQMSDLLRAG